MKDKMYIEKNDVIMSEILGTIQSMEPKNPKKPKTQTKPNFFFNIFKAYLHKAYFYTNNLIFR